MRRLFIPLFAFTLAHAQYRHVDKEQFTQDQAHAYCKKLPGGNWRLMPIDELFSVREMKVLHTGVSYWSSTRTNAEKQNKSTGTEGEGGTFNHVGYTCYAQDGDVTITPVEKQAGVVCTDRPPVKAKKVYETSGKGIIDRDNGILWHPLDATDKRAKLSYEKAMEACELLSLQGRSWRLPTLEELYSIVTYARDTPSVDTEHFGVMMSRYYWSETEFNAKSAYVVGFKRGSVATSAKGNRSYFRCVSELE